VEGKKKANDELQGINENLMEGKKKEKQRRLLEN